MTADNWRSLKPRLLNVLIRVLQEETDSSNVQIVLGQLEPTFPPDSDPQIWESLTNHQLLFTFTAAMLNLVQDAALLEAAGTRLQVSPPGVC